MLRLHSGRFGITGARERGDLRGVFRMKARTLLLVFALFFAAVAGAFAQTPIRDTAVLLVGAEAADGRRSICSGVVIAPSRILTAKHCLNAAFIARTSDGRLHAELRG